MTPARDEPAVASYVQRVVAGDADLLTGVVEARDLRTIVGLAACGIGVGLVPDCARAALRPDTRLCALAPPVELPGLVVSHHRGDTSPVVRAFPQDRLRADDRPLSPLSPAVASTPRPFS